MKLKFKNSFLGYFQFYYSIVGNKLIINLALSICVSFLDGLGLAMFIPLFQAVGKNGAINSRGAGGSFKFFTSLITFFGLDLNIYSLLFLLVIIFGVKGVIKFWQLNYQVNLRHVFMKKIRFSLVDSLRNLSYKGFLKLDAGRIQNVLTTEVQRLFVSMNYYFTAAQSVVMLLTYILLAFFANYQFAFLVAIGAGLSNFIYRSIYVATKKASLDYSKKGDDFNGFLIQSIHYFKYLKSTNYFSSFSAKLKDTIVKTEVLNKKMGYYSAITQAIREPMIIFIVAIVILLQIKFMGAAIPSMILSLLLFYRALSFLMVVQINWQGFIQGIGSMDSVATIHTQMNLESETFAIPVFDDFSKSIHLKDISFSYNPETTILDNIDVVIPKNQTIALVGESGSGKTTLGNLISGLIAPSVGSMLVDGSKINLFNINSYRSKIGYISQEPVIFSDDLFNNVTFWSDRTEENEKRFWEVIKLASLTDFINSLPQKELTVLGDNGILISGGQKQRISIARELYKKAEVLIFDEATSALDSETEKLIQENITRLHGSYTMVIIAHRLSTIKEADHIYLLEKGKVLASGTFAQILSSSEKFKRMVTLQEF